MTEQEGMENNLQNLLAVVHRDGGHYASRHGVDKATKDAMRIVVEERGLLEEIMHAAICIWPDVVVLSEIMDPHKQRLAEALNAYTRFQNKERGDARTQNAF